MIEVIQTGDITVNVFKSKALLQDRFDFFVLCSSSIFYTKYAIIIFVPKNILKKLT